MKRDAASYRKEIRYLQKERTHLLNRYAAAPHVCANPFLRTQELQNTINLRKAKLKKLLLK